MHVQVHLSQEEIRQQSKSWATVFGCVITLAIALSFAAEHLFR